MIDLRPASVEEAQKMLAEQRGSVIIRGAGTKLRETAADAVLHTAALCRIVEYAPSDQVVTAEAGTPLATLQRELAKHGQRLALDPPFGDQATLGGVVAANSFGPLRTRYGPVRDLIIGVSLIRADGMRAKGGGKVVKTVAGFDLPKLMCGSRGTLGLIATVTFRVHPVPEHVLSVVARGLPAAGVMDLVRKVRALQLEPAAMLAVRGAAGWEVALRFEGFRAGVVQQREKLRELDEAPPSVWAAHLASRGEGPVRIAFGALPAHVPQVEAALARFGTLSWYPTLGLGFASGTDADEVGAARRALTALGGWVVAEAGSPEVWGPPPAALRLHEAVKARLDPDGKLAPGSFIGGI